MSPADFVPCPSVQPGPAPYAGSVVSISPQPRSATMCTRCIALCVRSRREVGALKQPGNRVMT